MQISERLASIPEVAQAAKGEETLWLNPNKKPFAALEGTFPITRAQMDEAEQRMKRFAPYLEKVFPETRAAGGIIESPLREIPRMGQWLEGTYGVKGPWLLKMDCDLPIAGSIKARGGIYEVLQHAEQLAFEQGLLRPEDNYAILAEERFREFFSHYTIQVGSTGNLGLSIGIMSAKLGFQVIVHMSADAKQWKKDLLREKGVMVVEYPQDYGKAVEEGRRRSMEDSMSYFVDDENSESLFLGYTIAGRRLREQMEEQHIAVDEEHPLFVYLPCGIGGAPGGVAFGLKHEFGDAVHCFFAEPTEACCMLLGMATGLHDGICVQDVGLSGKTQADGLAVGRPSAFVGRMVEPLISGCASVKDDILFRWMKQLLDREGVFIEPSSCAAFAAAPLQDRLREYIRREGLEGKKITHLAWATGGKLVPQEERERYIAFAK